MGLLSNLLHLNDREKDKFRDGSDGSVVVGVQSIEAFNIGSYDEVQVTRPTSTTEVFTFKLATSTVATITLTYTDASKKDLQSAVKT